MWNIILPTEKSLSDPGLFQRPGERRKFKPSPKEATIQIRPVSDLLSLLLFPARCSNGSSVMLKRSLTTITHLCALSSNIKYLYYCLWSEKSCNAVMTFSQPNSAMATSLIEDQPTNKYCSAQVCAQTFCTLFPYSCNPMELLFDTTGERWGAGTTALLSLRGTGAMILTSNMQTVIKHFFSMKNSINFF